MRKQIETNLFGPMNVTRAVLPYMRQQRSGHVLTISSLGGVVGLEFCVAYAAAKFGVEGWMESLRFDLEPFGINTTIIEPGFFRTELLVEGSTTWADLSIGDYAERTTATKAAWQAMNGQQGGDPAKLAAAIIAISEQDRPPARFVAGADAIPAVEAKAQALLAQADASRQMGMNLALDHRMPPDLTQLADHTTYRKTPMELLDPQPSTKAPEQLFTGDAWWNVIYAGEAPSRARLNHVRFAPGARTNWHAHVLGQTLHVVAGVALVGTRDGTIIETHSGETVTCPPDEAHWHGATADQFMEHLALWEGDGTHRPETTWMEPVTDEQYDRSRTNTR